MTLTEVIRTALKENKAIIGYRKSIKFIKLNTAKIIVVAKNSPEEIRKEIEHNAKIKGVKVEIFDGSSKELGVICGKPFPVTTLVIKG
ncbi:MAG: 50S ribosomal protein L30e [Candidatus Aenigmatarchaeota archaeon]